MGLFSWFSNEFEDSKDTIEFQMQIQEIKFFEKMLSRMVELNMDQAKLAQKLQCSKRKVEKLFNNCTDLTLTELLQLSESVGCNLEINFIKKVV